MKILTRAKGFAPDKPKKYTRLYYGELKQRLRDNSELFWGTFSLGVPESVREHRAIASVACTHILFLPEVQARKVNQLFLFSVWKDGSTHFLDRIETQAWDTNTDACRQTLLDDNIAKLIALAYQKCDVTFDWFPTPKV